MDLQPLCSPVMDQGDIGSCTGNALAGAFEFLELKEMKDKATGVEASAVFGSTFDAVSRLFIYYNERAIEGTVDEDAGAEIRDGVKALASQGVCRDTLWTYEDSNLFLKPVTAAYEEAAKHKISSYARIDTLAEGKACLAGGKPFVMGFDVYANFESDECQETGMLKLPAPGEELMGGHAVMAVGYDDSKQCLKVRNSWGADWGLQGYFWMPYTYFSEDLISDCWYISK
jgi:C1A family cysteine protease